MATKAPAGEPERTRLSKAAVIDRALALVDADGLESVTIRRLAAELGVTPMALYWHFRSKDDLLAGLADRLWAEIDTDIDPAADWSAQLRGMMESLVQVLRAHPSASQLLLADEKRNSDASLVAAETTLAVLRRAGFDAQHAAAIMRSALWAGLTLVMSEPGNKPGMTEAERTETQRRARVRLSMLPPELYPSVVEASGPLTAADDAEFHYRFGIDLFIAGVRAVAPRRQHPASGSPE